MKRILDTSEILGTVDLPKGVSEVCASAEAGYDQDSGKLIVELKTVNAMLPNTSNPPDVDGDALPEIVELVMLTA